MKSSPSVRILLLSVIAAAVAFGAAAARVGSAPTGVDTLRGAEISRYSSFKDVALPHAKSALVLPATWPFAPTTSTGEKVTINLSQRLFQQTDAPQAQEWADFFAGLVHGPELSFLSVYILAPGQIETVCGKGALACYGGDRLFTPADDPGVNLSREAVATHEYGHHVAFHRRNDPWDAIDYGPKRWATYEQVCAKAKSGKLYPGAEDEEHYELNSGEGWAETFRVMNERRAGLVEAPWQIVTQSLYPTAAALKAAELDVTSPWTKSTSSTVTGLLTKKSKARTFAVATPLDGRLSMTLRSSVGESLALDVFSPSSSRLAHDAGKKGVAASVTTCGERALRVRVSRLYGTGPFRLVVSKP